MRSGTLAGLAAGATFFLVLLAAAAHPTAFAGTPASPHAATAGAPQTWSESDLSRANDSSSTFSSSETVASLAASGLTITASNTSSSVVEVETTTWAVDYFQLNGCAPRCSGAQETVALNESATLSSVLFENFTSAATVQANGSALAALGVLNASQAASSALAVSLAESGPGSNATSGSFNVTTSDSGSISFSGALGLIPWAYPSASFWNWTSAAGYTVSVTSTERTQSSGALGGAGGFPSAPGPIVGNGSLGDLGGAVGLLASAPALPIACLESINVTVPGWGWGNGSGSGSGPNTTTVLVPTYGGNCTYQGSGNETALGGSLFFGYGGGSGGYANGSGPVPPPSPAPSTAPWSNGSSAVLIATSPPYTPGPALSEVLAGSAFFNGGLRNWTTIEDFSSGGVTYGTSGGGSGGSSGGSGSWGSPPARGPPSGANGGDPNPGGLSGGSLRTSSGDPPAPAPMSGAVMLAVLLAAGAALVLVLVWRSGRRARGPPPAAPR